MKKTIHIEIDYTIPDTSKFCEPIIEAKIEGEKEEYLINLLNNIIFHLQSKEFFENKLKDFKEEYKKDVKQEIIKEYLQTLLDGEKNIDKEQ